MARTTTEAAIVGGPTIASTRDYWVLHLKSEGRAADAGDGCGGILRDVRPPVIASSTRRGGGARGRLSGIIAGIG